MTIPRKHYSKEEKLEIVKQSLDENILIDDLSKRYSVHPNTIYKWRKEYTTYDGNAFPGHGNRLLTDSEKEVFELKKQLRIGVRKGDFKKSFGHLLSSRQEKYSFIMNHKEQYPVEMMSRLLDVSPTAYYKWQKMNPLYEQAIAAINDEVTTIYKSSGNTYGSPRIQIELAKKGVKSSKSTISRVMKRCNLQARTKKKFVSTTDSKHYYEVPPNKLDRNFQVDEVNKVWVSDITYIQVKKEWMYLTVFLDLADRMVVSWTLSDNMMAKDTVIAAFNKAVQNRGLENNSGSLVHYDRCVQYACKEFWDELAIYNCDHSMSHKGNCWDNAVAESFFKTIKTEKLDNYIFNDAGILKSFIFRYIDGWYNTLRIHTHLDGRSPLEHFYFLNQKLAA